MSETTGKIGWIDMTVDDVEASAVAGLYQP